MASKRKIRRRTRKIKELDNKRKALETEMALDGVLLECHCLEKGSDSTRHHNAPSLRVFLMRDGKRYCPCKNHLNNYLMYNAEDPEWRQYSSKLEQEKRDLKILEIL